LAARKFDSILRIKCFEFSADAFWKQTFNFRAKDSRKDEQLQISDSPLLILKACDRLPARVPPKQLELEGESRLRPSLFYAQFSHLRAYDIEYFNTFFDFSKLAIMHGARCKLYQTLLFYEIA
jgi:hypothetical protein